MLAKMERFINLTEQRLENAEWRIRQVPVPRAKLILSKAAVEGGLALLESKGEGVPIGGRDLVKRLEPLFVATGELAVEHLATVESACEYLKNPHENEADDPAAYLARVQAFVQAVRVLLGKRQMQWIAGAPIDPRYDFTPPAPGEESCDFDQELQERRDAYNEWGPEIRRKVAG